MPNQMTKEGIVLATTINDDALSRPKKGRHATVTWFWSYLEYRHVKSSCQAMRRHW